MALTVVRPHFDEGMIMRSAQILASFCREFAQAQQPQALTVVLRLTEARSSRLTARHERLYAGFVPLEEG